MKQISKTILAVSIFICLAAASSTAQTVSNRASNAAYPDHQGGLQ
jgi:hypothetical protein